GTALYECVSVMFILQVYGIHLGFGEQFLVVALALMTSIGVAGIPSASLVAIVIILNAVTARLNVRIGMEAIAIIMVVDRILDMCRTAVNVFGDSCGAVIIAKTEGEENVLP
ncbi:MAG: cation:dicarboxylase symporter family transporter, partial [Victivallales bacterium]|nr:cation:dicarboxylase symporter family transporter [Victivallales bacterium]